MIYIPRRYKGTFRGRLIIECSGLRRGRRIDDVLASCYITVGVGLMPT